MKARIKLLNLRLLQILGTLTLIGCAMAAFASDTTSSDTRVVVQISSGDPQLQNMVLNNVANLQAEMGPDNVQIEVVAYGPGLSMLTTGSKFKDRVKSLSFDVRFSACENTIAAITRQTGNKPVLIDGVTTVPSGVARIVELQQQGYAYVRP